jgi:4-diphosphocytidyl-2-C-methyl-D-erythritol kinase
MADLSCPAPAKLNLFLHLTGRRTDGYHTLQTVFQLIDYSDTLHFTLRDDAIISRCTAVPDIPEADDLTIRAARTLQAYTHCPLGVDIRIEKRLPISAGLGGGSSDAASVLLALNRLWKLDLSRLVLQEIALSLGADVPFFIFGRNAFAQGIGEQLQSVDLPPRHFLIITPRIAVSTAEIFSTPELTCATKAIKISAFLEKRHQHPDHWPDHFGHNDMQAVVSRQYEEMATLLDWFNKHIAPARMTGSGPSIFAAFPGKEQAAAARSQLPPEWASIAAITVAAGLVLHPLFYFAS